MFIYFLSLIISIILNQRHWTLSIWTETKVSLYWNCMDQMTKWTNSFRFVNKTKTKNRWKFKECSWFFIFIYYDWIEQLTFFLINDIYFFMIIIKDHIYIDNISAYDISNDIDKWNQNNYNHSIFMIKNRTTITIKIKFYEKI